MRWLARIWPAIVWAALIAFFSTHYFTNANTGRVIFPLLHYLFPHHGFLYYLRLNFLIRKGAHVTEYFIFSLILLHVIRGPRSGWRVTWALWVILIVFGYACTDELHQAFAPGRGPSFFDVMLDTSAGVMAQVLAGVWFALKKQFVGHKHEA